MFYVVMISFDIRLSVCLLSVAKLCSQRLGDNV